MTHHSLTRCVGEDRTSKVCRRLQTTSIIDHGRFMRRQYRGLRTSATVLLVFLVAWFPYCFFVTTIYVLIAVDIIVHPIRTGTLRLPSVWVQLMMMPNLRKVRYGK